MRFKLLISVLIVLSLIPKVLAQCNFEISAENMPESPDYFPNQQYLFLLYVNHYESQENISTVIFWDGKENRSVEEYDIVNENLRVYRVRMKDLAAGEYNFEWYVNDSQNCWENLTVNYVINKAISSVSVYFYPSNYAKYDYARIFCNITQGDKLAYLKLYENDTLVLSGNGNLTYNPDVGYYNYTCYYNESQNYTSSYSTNNFLTVWHPCDKNHPPLSGNWIISSLTTCICPFGENVTLRSHTYIYNNLTIQNCLIYFTSSFHFNSTNATLKIENSTINSSSTPYFYCRGNSSNKIINSSFNKGTIYFEENSINTITNSNFSSNIQLTLKGNSINTVINSSFSSTLSIDRNSTNEIKDSKLNLLNIYSSLPHNLTISNLFPGNFITTSFKAENSNFSLNLTNSNISLIRVYSSSGNLTILNSILGFSYFRGSSRNRIINTTFIDIQGSTSDRISFFENSINYISNSTFLNQTNFYGFSKNHIENSLFNDRARFYEYSSTNISNSRIRLQIGSTVSHILTISNLWPDNFITKRIKATSSFEINLTNVNITHLHFWGSGSSNNTLINLTCNGDSYFEGNSSNEIINSTFSATAYFYINSTNFIQNSYFRTISLGDWYISTPVLNFSNSTVKNWIVASMARNPVIKGRLTNIGSVSNWASSGNVTRYYPIRVLYTSGKFAQGINVSILSSLEWSGCTNQLGYAVDPLGIEEPKIFFNYSNYNKDFVIYVNDSVHWNVSEKVNFLTNTTEEIIIYLEGEPVTPYKHHGYLGINYTPLTLGRIFPVNVYVVNEGVSEDDYRIDVFYPNQAYVEVYSRYIINVKPNSIKKGQIGIKLLSLVPKENPINITVRITCLRCPCVSIDEKNITVYGGNPDLKEFEFKEVILLFLISVLILLKWVAKR